MNIEDEELRTRVTQKLVELNIPFVDLRRRPDDTNIVLTDGVERKGVISIRNGDFDGAIENCLRMWAGKNRYVRVLVGIDPGPEPGIAVFGDNNHLIDLKAKNPEDTLKLLKKTFKIYGFEECVVRVGDGGGVYRDRIVNGILSLGVRVEISDESETSGRGGKKDIEAARKIAFIEGIEVKKAIVLRVKDGELREIQKESRKISNVTISRDLARKVAEGRIGMKTAIKKQTKH